jgi:hypothetical protein
VIPLSGAHCNKKLILIILFCRHKTVTEESLLELAKQHEVTTGKWLIAVPWTEADEVWQKLVNGLLEGKFPDDLGVTFIKVFGRSVPKKSPYYLHKGKLVENSMMSVATPDWTNKEKTMEVSKVIRGLGIHYELKYKQDLYSILDILTANPYKLRPTIYRS